MISPVCCRRDAAEPPEMNVQNVEGVVLVVLVVTYGLWSLIREEAIDAEREVQHA